jgi:quinoprotein dehydrogenase-associated probable ABC transporter substrate-binding protein
MMENATSPMRQRPRPARLRLPVLIGSFAAALLASQGAAETTGDLVAKDALRVCADPNDLPYSNEQHEGFENKIAELLGKDLSLPVQYVWFPQVVGFVRNTLRAGQCDLVMGTVAGDELMQTTTPYYYTSYVAIFRKDKPVDFSNFDDPKLKSLHIGVVSRTPPADLLVRHGLMANAKPYALTVDTRYESPTHQMVSDVESGTIDAGLLWGPIAGYYIHRDHLPLSMTLLKSEPGAPRMAYHVAMGVRANEPDWRRRLNAAIHRHEPEITGILRDYGVPLLDEKGNPLSP